MEPIGLTVSIASLAGLFETAVDCFRYIQVAKTFGTDFQTSCLQLDSTYLRLARWGEAVGFGGSIDNSITLQQAHLSEHDVERVESLLGHIISLFKDAEEISNNFKAKRSSTNVVEIGALLPTDTTSLHQRMREICQRRQKSTSYRQKAKWVIYEKEHMDKVVETVQGLVSDLVELFPAAKQVQQQLCHQEAKEMQDEAALPMLEEIAARQDHLLADAITKLSASRTSTVYNTWENKDNTKVLNQIAGNQTFYGGQTYSL